MNAETADEPGLSAVDAAPSALESWRDTSPPARRDLFLEAAELMTSRLSKLGNDMIQVTWAQSTWANFKVDSAWECFLDCANRVMTTEGNMPSLANSSQVNIQRYFGNGTMVSCQL